MERSFGMDREKALDILGLHEDATVEDVSRRYDVLFKKFKYADTDNKGNTKDQLEEAYRLLMDLDFHDPEAERKKIARKEHPNPLFKLLKIDEEKASNAIYYYKWKVLIGIVILALAVSFILGIINRVDPDLKVVFAGEIVISETAPLENQIIAGMENVKAPQIQCITLTDQLDSQTESISVQKLSLELMSGKNDILVMDMKIYQEYASYGAFKSLNDMKDELGIKSYDKNLEVAVITEDGQEYPAQLYGVDVSKSPLLRDYGVMGGTLIAALLPNGDNPVNANEYFKKLIESVQ